MRKISNKSKDLTGYEFKKIVDDFLVQYPKMSDMEANVACCSNCDNWVDDKSLQYRYEFNTCRFIGTAAMTKCCHYCDNYKGAKTEIPPIVYHLIITDDEGN